MARSKKKAKAHTAPKLTPKLRAFAAAYAGRARGNATEAARLAGYAGNDVTLGAVGHENLKKPQVRALLAELERETRSAEIADRHEIQRRLTLIARRRVRDDHVTPMGDVVRIRPTSPAVTAALMALAKMRGYLIDKIEVKAEDQLRAQLERLRKRMSPDAFEQLLEVIVEGDAGDET